MLIFLAGLQGVPRELYEAAELDGANAWSQFRHVTLPMISPTVLFNLILGVIGALQVFTIAFAGTDGRPRLRHLVLCAAHLSPGVRVLPHGLWLAHWPGSLPWACSSSPGSR